VLHIARHELFNASKWREHFYIRFNSITIFQIQYLIQVFSKLLEILAVLTYLWPRFYPVPLEYEAGITGKFYGVMSYKASQVLRPFMIYCASPLSTNTPVSSTGILWLHQR
jgi:hypothetical protein